MPRKTCRGCGLDRPLNAFRPQLWGDGRGTRCVTCRSAQVLAARHRRRPPRVRTIEARLLERSVTHGACRVWQGAKTSSGYGLLAVGKRSPAGHCQPEYVHRLAYEAFVGPIPPGLTVDHLCRTRACVNPEHMELVTPAENSRRGSVARWQEAHRVIAI